MRRVNIAICFFLALAMAAAPRSVREGVYTKEQANRGQATYRTECARCHGENLLGGDDAPELAGADFLQKWNGNPVGRLFDLIRKTMPSDGPGTISARQSSDLVAYLLSANELPAGQKELETDAAALNEIRIEPKQ
jgi:S-disulfanyl-L-cysteine oxidoreductase SoxD